MEYVSGDNKAQTLWFRESELDEISSKNSLSTIRLGDRSCNTMDQKGGYCADNKVKVLFQKQDGSFLDRLIEASVEKMEVKTIADLSAPDFNNSLQSISDKEKLLAAFEHFYERKLSGEERVSVIRLKFIR